MRNFFGVLVFLLVLSGCDEDDKKLHSLTKSKTAEIENLGPDTIAMRSGQFVATVKVAELNSWLYARQEYRIVSICSFDYTGNGNTTGFVIVFERAK